MHKINKKEESRKHIFRNAQRENGEAQLHMTTWAKLHRKRVLGLATSPPRKGGGQASQPRCARTPGGVARAQPLQAVAWWHAWSVSGSFLIYQGQTDHQPLYKKGWSSLLKTHIIWSYTSPLSTCTLLALVLSSIWS